MGHSLLILGDLLNIRRRTRRRLKIVGGIVGGLAVVGLSATVVASALSPSEPPPVSEKVASYLATPQPTKTEELIRLPDTSRPKVASAMGLLGDQGRAWTLNVLGDSTGNDSDEYVFLLAQQLSDIYNRPTIIHVWADGKGYAKEVPVGGGENAPIHIWNGSVPGQTGAYAKKNIDEMARKDADLIIVNYGHNYSGAWNAQTITRQLVTLLDQKIGAKPMLFMLQNPWSPETPGSTAVAGAMREIVTGSKYEYVDVYKAFKDTGKAASLMHDHIHPNPAGSQVWADAVASKLSL